MAGFQNCGLNIFKWNCNGLLAHQNELKQHLSHILCNNSFNRYSLLHLIKYHLMRLVFLTKKVMNFVINKIELLKFEGCY